MYIRHIRRHRHEATNFKKNYLGEVQKEGVAVIAIPLITADICESYLKSGNI